MGDLTAHFSRIEFHCRGLICCEASRPVHPGLVLALEELRERCRAPIIVSSGFRCRKYNMVVRGSRGSQHCFGMAADILVPVSIGLDAFKRAIVRIEAFHGIGGLEMAGVKWIHVDVREGDRVFW